MIGFANIGQAKWSRSEVRLLLARLRAPNCADGKQATRDPRPADSLVAVVTHDATDHPAHKLLGCIEFPRASEYRRGSSSALTSDTNAVIAGKPSRENARHSAYRSGVPMIDANSRPREVRP